ncbi:hypothetical protein GUI12_02440 [Anaplasmataceae bacterium AB001_6]|nr:hypothetical protein GUI12_02440 [Anaplasmataceae bacterium AB001_6]
MIRFPNIIDIDNFYSSIYGKKLYHSLSNCILSDKAFYDIDEFKQVIFLGYSDIYRSTLSFKKSTYVNHVKYQCLDDCRIITSLDDIALIEKSGTIDYLIVCHFLEYQKSILDSLGFLYDFLSEKAELIIVIPNMYGYLKEGICFNINTDILKIRTLIKQVGFFYKKTNFTDALNYVSRKIGIKSDHYDIIKLTKLDHQKSQDAKYIRSIEF